MLSIQDEKIGMQSRSQVQQAETGNEAAERGEQ